MFSSTQPLRLLLQSHLKSHFSIGITPKIRRPNDKRIAIFRQTTIYQLPSPFFGMQKNLLFG